MREEKSLVENVNIALHAGELLQIRGKNGAGKTTLLKLLAGFLHPSSGNLITPQNIAYLGHEPAFTSWLTVEENIKFTAALHHAPAHETNALLQQFSLQDQASVFPYQLSQGQKRRLAFALLLLSRATLWLLDEPFTALDKEAVKLIQELILKHLALKGIVAITLHQKITWPISIQEMVLK